jgi:hypothetical protein
MNTRHFSEWFGPSFLLAEHEIIALSLSLGFFFIRFFGSICVLFWTKGSISPFVWDLGENDVQSHVRCFSNQIRE